MTSILETPSGRIKPNWTVSTKYGPNGFAVVAPYNDGLPGEAVLGSFKYRPHAHLAAAAPAIVEAAENLLIAIGMGWDLDGCVEKLQSLIDPAN